MVRDLGGDSLSQARALKPGSTRRDALGGLDANDFYSVKLSDRSSFKLAVRGLQSNADVELIRDRNNNGAVDLGEVVASSRAPNLKTELIAIDGLEKGTYFVRVFLKGDGSTTYRLALSATPTSNVSPTYDVVLRTNQLRSRIGLHPLAVNTQLTNAAQAYARTMAEQDNFSHTGLDGSAPWDRIKASGYDYVEPAENLAAVHTTAASAVRGWYNSPGHRNNMLSYKIQEIGVGYYYLRNDTGKFTYQHYWSQSMATPADGRAAPNDPTPTRDGGRFPRFPEGDH